jgi:hypothetical protein
MLELCPENEPIMQQAWMDCLMWTIRAKVPNFLAAFTDDTGISFPAPPRSALDAMIDDATGVWSGVVPKYIAWFNHSVWGDSKAAPVEDDE